MQKFKNQEHSLLLKSPRNTTMFSKMQKYTQVGRLRILLTGLANLLNPFLFFSYKNYWWIMFILEKHKLFSKYILLYQHNGTCKLVCLIVWSHQSEWTPKCTIECLCVLSRWNEWNWVSEESGGGKVSSNFSGPV